jgi:arylsulfatase A
MRCLIVPCYLLLVSLLQAAQQPPVVNLPSVSSAEPSKPNVVLILADDLGYGDLSCYGATQLNTPNIDRIAESGIRFTHAYAPGAICSPSRYAIMTGRYDWRTAEHCGVLMENAALHLEPGRLTLGSMLQKQGYKTGYVGKWHLGLGMRSQVDWNAPLIPGPLEVGFDTFFGLPANHENHPEIYIEGREIQNRIAGEPIVVSGPKPNQVTTGVSPLRDNEACGPELAGKAVAFIQGAPEGEPFFLFYAPIEPHIPITPHADFKDSSECGPYGDFIQQLDHHVGEILAALEAKGELETTLILFTSDNGGLVHPENHASPQGEALRRGHHINGELRGRKHVIYEGGIRVPLIASWPGQIPAGTESAQVVSLVDIMATLGEFTDYTFDHRELIEDSFSIAPVLIGQHPEAEAVRPPVVSMSCIGTFSVRDGDYKIVEQRELIPQLMQHVRGQYLGWGAENHQQVYNVAKDASESQNIIAERPDVYERLTEVLNRYRRDGSSKGFDPNNYK